MRAAILINDKVWNIVETNSLVHPEYTLEPCGPEVQIGWRWNGATFENTPWDTPAEARRALRAALRARRIKAQESGVPLGQRIIPTDREFRLQLRELKDWSQGNPAQQVPVEVDNGDVIRVTAAQLNTAIAAVSTHMRDCLDIEATKIAEIEALTSLSDAAQWMANSLDSGWPS